MNPDKTLNINDKNDTKSENAVRFSVSLPSELARELDIMIGEKGYSNRSQFISDIVRDRLIDHQAETSTAQIAGTITIVYDHHKPKLQSLLTELQHDNGDLIVSTLHVHLDHHNCLEVLVVRGDAARIRVLADSIISTKGVKNGRLTVTGTGTTHA
jgi:CopG family nickel-responsive transcriptional regulator